ncbi:hypothetical protein LINPERHAP2_LOCUS27283 [Linum perenne]
MPTTQPDPLWWRPTLSPTQGNVQLGTASWSIPVDPTVKTLHGAAASSPLEVLLGCGLTRGQIMTTTATLALKGKAAPVLGVPRWHAAADVALSSFATTILLAITSVKNLTKRRLLLLVCMHVVLLDAN